MAEDIFKVADRSLIDAFLAAADRMPDAPLVVASAFRPGSFRLADIVADGLRFAAGLRALGIGPGDIVAVQLPAWSEGMVACFGIAHVGAVSLPIVSIYGPRETGFILRQSGARAIVTPDRWRRFEYGEMLGECGDLPALRAHVVIGDAVPTPAATWRTIPWADMLKQDDGAPPARREPDDLALLIYTSGTTADPKGVRHSSRSLLSELAVQTHIRRGIVESNFSPWPPGHVGGTNTILRYLVYAPPLVLMDQWDAGEAAMLIERHRASVAAFTPFHLTGILDAADRDDRDLSSLVNCMVGAAPVSPSLIERCTARGLRTFRAYGSSEHPTVTSGEPDDPLIKRLTTEGRLLPGCEMRFVDDDGNELPPGVDGEIVTRGPELFLGYFDDALNAAAMLPGGWYRTGDIGHFDPDGYLVVSDRKKDIIIRGGENIASREVEEILLGDPTILDAAVVAFPDVRMGEVVCAYVVPRPDATVTLDSVRAHFAAAGVARQKTPERVVCVADFPRNGTGKVLKQELRARARAEARELIA